MPKRLTYSLSLIALSAILITLCYFFVDRQLVWFLASHHSRNYAVFPILANDPVLAIGILIFLFYLYFFIKLSLGRTHKLEKKFVIACNAVVIGLFLKNMCKIIFARYWPATFVCHNPSLLSGHAYGFNWFQSSSAFASFPSGHTTFAFAFGISMWCLFPRLRIVWGLIAIGVALGQIGSYYHFVSDVIAGATLGGLVGYFTALYACREA